jgi:hypothetical protein
MGIMPDYTVEGEFILKYTGDELDEFICYLADEVWALDITKAVGDLYEGLPTGCIVVSLWIQAEDAPKALAHYKAEIEEAFAKLCEPAPIIQKYTIQR